MSTLVRVIIVVIEFLVLFAYEFFHIRKEIKNHNDESKIKKYGYALTTKEYKIFAAIFYSILNILFIVAFLFIFPKHIFLCYNKLLFLGCIITFIIFFNLINYIEFEKNISHKTLVMVFSGIFSLISLLSLIYSAFMTPLNFVKIIDKKEHCEEISNIDNIIKYKKNNHNNIYILDFKDTNKIEIIYETDINTFEISDNTSIFKTTTTTTKYSSELRNKEYKETEITYDIYVTEDMLIDLTIEY